MLARGTDLLEAEHVARTAIAAFTVYTLESIRAVVARAHTEGVWVEGEPGALAGVDALAVAVGTVHGFSAVPILVDLDRLAAIAAGTSTPLVLHGASGLPDDNLAARDCSGDDDRRHREDHLPLPQGATDMTSVGWIGLGAMGGPMAQCVAAAGHTVSAYDVSLDRARSLAGAGLTAVDSIGAAARGAEVLVLMVATPDQVEAVLFGEGGAAAHLESGAVVVVMATVGPGPVEGWARRLGVLGIGLVDAPVSGGVTRAAKGDLLVMVSGSAEDLAVSRPIIDAMASTAPVVGPNPGDGQKVKVVNQLLCGVHIAAAGEALALADSMGLDVEATWEVLKSGAAGSFMFGDRGGRMVTGDFDDVRSALDIFVKDMGIVTTTAKSVEQPTPLAATAEQLYLTGRRKGLGRKDDSIVYDILRGRAD